ncbi:MAG: hypothetical protein LRZ99_06695 [Desulfotomaculum sp.]|nr:hypothetical protein [Desulfotomaculum sp.]
MISSIFLVCFLLGLVFAVLQFILGDVFDVLGFDVGDSVSIFNIKPALIAIFLTVFGGVGLICSMQNINLIITLIMAIITATGVAFLVQKLVLKPLYKAQKSGAVLQQELVGKLAEVKVTINEDACGSIKYTANSNVYSAPAKSMNKEKINIGEEVVIIKIEDNLFYVDKADFSV